MRQNIKHSKGQIGKKAYEFLLQTFTAAEQHQCGGVSATLVTFSDKI